MPIPLIIGGAAVIAGLYGAKKAKDASDNYSSAKSLVGRAFSDFNDAKDKLEADKDEVNNALQNLGKLRLSIQSQQMLQYIEIIKKVNNASFKRIDNESSAIEVTAPEIGEIEVSSYKAADLVKDGVGAVSAGALAGIGAGGLATSIGVASTGTAIGTLSGVAATNATLAWLGGGALSAGGMGVTGGKAVLGGAIAGPVIAVMGYAYAKKSEKALSEAFKKESEIRQATAQVENGILVVKSINTRVAEVESATTMLSDRFSRILVTFIELIREKEELRSKLIIEVDWKISEYKKKNIFLKFFNRVTRQSPKFIYSDPLDFNNFSQADKNQYMTAMNVAYSLYSLLKVKVLNDEGAVSSDSEVALIKAQSALEAK